MADAVATGQGSVTGVDVQRERLAACRNLLQKYASNKVRLFLGDGCTFAEGPASWMLKPMPTVPEACSHAGDTTEPTPKRARPSERELLRRKEDARLVRNLPRKDRHHACGNMFFCSPDLRAAREAYLREQDAQDEAQTANPPVQATDQLYDKVLVDAECTHDGSIKHLTKFDRWGWSTFEQRFFDPTRISQLETLQRGLLQNGFRRLREGGTLVYSTCSFSHRQNEDIVQWLLDHEPGAQLLSCKGMAAFPAAAFHPLATADVLKFSPVATATSGLFVARFTKQPFDPAPQPPSCNV
ncbi:uncharacterized protein MONBRDRAFT_38325 [Monosiga brevicollis MX1]|uniref:SAM-dependent MTase RsmB/NOP-type domain-containing protein n=1 Tax=Monosiga brevicollis TaxID=81824 RepID=A9V709_MONBE|nr:uncharacterized protein MONBRDRAFT_38325 [Monosiga brevicollis MX1]EDQ86638.1 predicted protein [Monosiga brevicollis MX1]|eukprot:XP_001748474.1 hypothetical protein [Monosiga brevicollis MX1]